MESLDMLAHEQVEDHSTQAVAFVRLKADKATAYCALSHRTDDSRFHGDGCLHRGWFDGELKQCANRQRCRGFEGTAVHGQFRCPSLYRGACVSEYGGLKRSS
ncbi:MAG: hypothetical protein NNA18_09370 [Nitrospira sp.]|nr:hypothetical protein [Nitrospira sp.]